MFFFVPYLPPSVGQYFVRRYWTRPRILIASTIATLTFIALFIYFHSYRNHLCLDQFGVLGVPHAVALEPLPFAPHVYQMLYDVHQVLNSAGIFYVIGGHTLLGAVRHSGLIPWNHDSEFLVNLDEFDEIDALLHKAAKSSNGLLKAYSVRSFNFGWSIRPIVKGNPLVHTQKSLNIYLMEFEGDQWRFDDNQIQLAHTSTPLDSASPRGQCIFKRDEAIGSRKRLKFGGYQLYTVHNPTPFLKRCYGEEFMKIEFLTFDRPYQKIREMEMGMSGSASGSEMEKENGNECHWPSAEYTLGNEDLKPAIMGNLKRIPGDPFADDELDTINQKQQETPSASSSDAAKGKKSTKSNRKDDQDQVELQESIGPKNVIKPGKRRKSKFEELFEQHRNEEKEGKHHG